MIRAPDSLRAIRRAPADGFTLVEVLVALTIMAVLAAMSFRGIDALSHAREGAQTATDRTLKLNSGMSQFEYDMSQIVNTEVVQAIDFHGGTLRVTRRTPDGIVLVVWSLQGGRWQRWASAPLVRIADLQEQWLRSQQWSTLADRAVPILDNVTDFQVYCFRGGWSNCQSSGNVVVVNAPASGASSPASAPDNGKSQTVAPTGIQIVLTLPGGTLVRERELPPMP